MMATSKALRRVRVCPLRFDAIAKAASSCSTSNTAAHCPRVTKRKGCGTVNTSVSATWQHIGHTVSSADIIWLNEQLAYLEDEALLRPWPPSDLVGTPRMRWQGHSPDTAGSMTAEILAEAVAGYRDLVKTNLPAFGPALGLYSLLPARVEGTITYSEALADTLRA